MLMPPTQPVTRTDGSGATTIKRRQKHASHHANSDSIYSQKTHESGTLGIQDWMGQLTKHLASESDEGKGLHSGTRLQWQRATGNAMETRPLA